MLISSVCPQYFVTLSFFPFLDQNQLFHSGVKIPYFEIFYNLNSDQLYLEIISSSPDYIQTQNTSYK